MIEVILLVFAFVFFSVSAYLTSDLATKLTRIGFALITLVYILSISGLHLR